MLFQVLNVFIQLLEKGTLRVRVELPHYFIEVIEIGHIVDPLLMVNSVPALLPDFGVPIVKGVHFLHQVEHHSLVILHLIMPFVQYDLLAVLRHEVSHVASVVGSVSTESLQEFHEVLDVKDLYILDESFFVPFQSPIRACIKLPIAIYRSKCVPAIHVSLQNLSLIICCRVILQTVLKLYDELWIVDVLFGHVV